MKFVKWIVHRAFYYMGVYRLIRFLASDKIIIFMLHGVCRESQKDSWVPSWERHKVEQIEIIVSELKTHFTFVTMDEAVEMIQGRTAVKKNCIVLTFDDGYKNNLTQAHPVLRSLNVPMVIYPTTDAIEQQKPYWIDRLDYALQLIDKCEVELRVGKKTYAVRLKPRACFIKDYRKARIQIKDNYSNDYAMLKDLSKAAEELELVGGKKLVEIINHDPWSAVLTKNDLTDLPEGVEIGSHTISHVRTTHVSKEQLERELRDSKNNIENWLSGRRCEHFCYPNGDFNQLIANRVKEAGYKSAVTTTEGLNRCGDNPYTLRRLSFPHANNRYEAQFKLSKQLWKFV